MRAFESFVGEKSDYFGYTASSLAKKLYFYPVIVGHFSYEPGYCLRRNNYDSFLIKYIEHGSCRLTLENRNYTAVSGDVVLIDCYHMHQYESNTGWESTWLHFDGPLARDYYDKIIELHGNIIIPQNGSDIRNTLHKIYENFKENIPVEEASFSLDLTRILSGLLSMNPPDKNCRTRLPLSGSISYINEHFAENLSLEQLAQKASLSPFYFTRLFSAETGMTPHRYLIAARINHARFLLKTTPLSIKEIAFTCGFTSESAFCSCFRKWEQLTPGDYRLLDSV